MSFRTVAIVSNVFKNSHLCLSCRHQLSIMLFEKWMSTWARTRLIVKNRNLLQF